MRFLFGVAAIYAVLQGSAALLASDRGQAGLLVAALVVGTTLAIERAWFAGDWPSAARAVGLGRPRRAGVAVACGVTAALLLILPLFAAVSGASIGLSADWLSLLPGLFAQGGIAEEVLFRGYLFGHLRRGRSFWRAAVLATGPFVLVHLLLFATMPWAIALAALLLSVVLSFPLARLFELGGATIWAPALLHFAVQGTVKVIVVSGEGAAVFPLVWMAGSAVLPMSVFLLRQPQARFDGQRVAAAGR